MAFTLAIGDAAPDFSLPATDGKVYRLADFSASNGLLVFFTCNHCPYVINSDELVRQLALEYMPKGIAFVAISSNSSAVHPVDGFKHMIARMQQEQFPWHYLRDKEQTAARSYGALRTPHYYLFNTQRLLVYTGRAFDNPRSPANATSHDLARALQEYTAGTELSIKVTNPVGCNIKWEGKDPHWMPPEACDLVSTP